LEQERINLVSQSSLLKIFREDKKLKLEQIKNYLKAQALSLGDPQNEAGLKLTDLKDLKGEASIAVIRG